MISQRAGLQFDSEALKPSWSGLVQCLLGHNGEQPPLQPLLDASPCMELQLKAWSPAGIQHILALEHYQNPSLTAAAISSIFPLSLLQCSWLGQVIVLGKCDFTLLVRRHSEALVVSRAPLWEKPC